MKYEEMLKICYAFFDTIDFEQFTSNLDEISVEDLMDEIEDYYDIKHPELLPKEFDGYFFNFINAEEFAVYLKNRYDYRLRYEIIEHHYLYKPIKGEANGEI